ncbi:SMC-Scp complex subunit ScpB [Promethearchaeum syntrophicum]|uniref:SMC-Scp complex subunit ScpB n=1 Tax=Promethearchaeum syntrophicum TaxID=2594042 RepID=A0A5B9DG65_9ARCH|nr:SMC-Scp complex subunit ScpB [Candidatus Prometheoarchaeum syntrophicum]QEE17667.1 segregation and condensation protein B [Candidatus Prometheoarchaeum syntrophicum]
MQQLNIPNFEQKMHLEAILFLSNQGISIADLSKKMNLSPKTIRKLATELIEDYQNQSDSLEIYENEEIIYMKVKPKIMRDPKLAKFLHSPKLKPGEIKTLGYIAINQPIEQQDIIDFVGISAKRSIQQLFKQNFIAISKIQNKYLDENGKERKKTTKEFKTTQFFADYFGVENNINEIQEKLNDSISKLS